MIQGKVEEGKEALEGMSDVREELFMGKSLVVKDTDEVRGLAMPSCVHGRQRGGGRKSFQMPRELASECGRRWFL